MTTVALIALGFTLVVVMISYLPCFTVLSVLAFIILVCNGATLLPAGIMTIGLFLDLFLSMARSGSAIPAQKKYRCNEYDYDDPS